MQWGAGDEEAVPKTAAKCGRRENRHQTSLVPVAPTEDTHFGSTSGRSVCIRVKA